MLANLNSQPMRGWPGTRTTIKRLCIEEFRAAPSSLTVTTQSPSHGRRGLVVKDRDSELQHS